MKIQINNRLTNLHKLHSMGGLYHVRHDFSYRPRHRRYFAVDNLLSHANQTRRIYHKMLLHADLVLEDS